jgi:SAM-dependent methyltransferase
VTTSATAVSEEAAEFLVTTDGGQLLEEVTSLPGDIPTRVLALRKRGLEPGIASAALAVAEARHRARFRYPDAAHLFFTPEALAQATSPIIAAYHAEQIAASGAKTVADLGCGVGMDTLALAEAGLAVLALERDASRLVFARANAVLRGVADKITFRREEVTALNWDADAAFWDPSRRTGPEGRRVSRHGDQYEPPLDFLAQVRTRVRKGGCIKLSPALPDDTLAELNGRVEFLSEARECKEACVWFGDVKGIAGDRATAAVLLSSGRRLIMEPAEDPSDPSAGALGQYLFDPDPAVLRSGALGTLANRLGAHRLGAADTYLTGDTLPDDSLRAAVFAYRIVEAQPYRPKQVGAALCTRDIGRLIVKKRYFPKEPEAVARELQIKGGSREGILVLVRTTATSRPEFWAVLCEPL